MEVGRRAALLLVAVGVIASTAYAAPASAARFGIQEDSLQFSDSASHQRHDVRTLFTHARAADNVLLAGTEAGASTASRRLLPTIGGRYGFGVWVAAQGGEWVAWDRSWGRLVAKGYRPVVDAERRSIADGGHAARGITWATIQPRTPAIGRVTIGAVHYLTRRSLRHQPGANVRLRTAATEWSRIHGHGSRLAFLAGDTNQPDRRVDAFGSLFSTSWDALHRYPGTRKATTLDVIARRVYDSRVRFIGARSYPDTALPMFTDHDLIQTRVNVSPRRSHARH